MDVSIIIVNYNTRNLTDECIRSVLDNTKQLEYEIILVDNASSDGSQEFFENFAHLIFVQSGKNLGFGKANNLGYTYAKGKYIFLLNSDTILLNNAVKIFYDAMENSPKEVGCIGAPLIGADRKTITTSYGSFPKFNEIYSSLYNLYLGKLLGIKKQNVTIPSEVDCPTYVDYVIGADLFIRKNVIEECGFFCPDFFMYFEETELQLRYSKSGYKSQLISGPKIIHLEPSIKALKKKKYTTGHNYIFFESMFLYYKKEYPAFKYLFWRILNLGYLPTTFTTQGTVKLKFQLLLLFFGLKTIKH